MLVSIEKYGTSVYWLFSSVLAFKGVGVLRHITLILTINIGVGVLVNIILTTGTCFIILPMTGVGVLMQITLTNDKGVGVLMYIILPLT